MLASRREAIRAGLAATALALLPRTSAGLAAPFTRRIPATGEAMPDAWYRQRFPVPGGAAPEYARPLSRAEVLGVVEYNLGNERRRQLRLAEARAAFTRSVQAFPQLSEAHASLGAVEQLLGNLEAAAASYRRAQDVNPHLPGIDQNLALLSAELALSGR